MIDATKKTTFTWANADDKLDLVMARGYCQGLHFYEVEIVAGDPMQPDWISTRVILAKNADEAKKPFKKIYPLPITIEAERAKIYLTQGVRKTLRR